MPAVVPLVAAVAGAYVSASIAAIPLGLLAGGAFAGIGVSSAFIGAVAGGITTFSISAIGQRALTKKPNAFASSLDQGLKQVVRLSDASQKLIYGRSRVGGVLVYIDTASSGLNANGALITGDNAFLHMVIAVAGHEIDSVEQIYLNDTLVTLDGNGFVTEAAFASTDFGVSSSRVRIKTHLGADDQTADTDLISEVTNWTTDHRLRGIAYVYVRLQWDQTVFTTGIPTVNVVVKGKKVYDPRTTLTAWSDNAALCIRDYLTSRDGADLPFGFGALASEIDDDFTIAAANICDETITKLDSSTIARYSCNGVIDTANAPLDNLQALVTALAGAVTCPKGIFRIYAGAYDTPESTVIDESMLAGGIKTRNRIPRQDLFNAVRGTYVSEAAGWQATDFPPITSPVYEEEDGGETIYTDIVLPFTTDSEAAQRIAKLIQRKGREQITVTVTLKPKALQFAVWDTVKVTNTKRGWSEKVFRIENLTFGLTSGVVLLLKEENALSYDWSATDAEAEAAAPDTNLPNVLTVSQPQDVEAESGTDQLLIAGDGTILSRILVEWTTSSDAFVKSGGMVQIRFKVSTDTVWQDAPPALGDASQAYITGVNDGDTYDIQVRFKNAFGTESEWTPISHTVIGKTALPSDVSRFTINGKQLAWTPVTDLDLAGYKVKFQPGISTSWGDAIEMHNGLLTSSPYEIIVVPSGTNSILIKAVDTSGNESQNPAIIVTDFGDPVVANILETFDRKAANWPGTLTSGSIDGSNNLLADDSPLMWNANVDIAMWSSNGNDMMWAAGFGQLIYEDRVVITTAVTGSRMTIAETVVGSPWSIEYRENSPALMWATDDTRLMWDEDDDPMWDTPAYQPWPGGILVGNSIYDIKITVGSGPIQGEVSEFTIIVDAPTIEELLNDVAISAGSTRLSLTESFNVISNIQLTVQTDGGGALTARYEDKDVALGPLIKCFDVSGSPVSGTLDARISGY